MNLFICHLFLLSFASVLNCVGKVSILSVTHCYIYSTLMTCLSKGEWAKNVWYFVSSLKMEAIYWGLSIYTSTSYSSASTILLLQLIHSKSSQFLLPDYSTSRFIAVIDGMDKRCRCKKIIDEIISTEESYVRHLGLIVKVSWVRKVESDFSHEPRHFVGNETIFLKWAGN